MWADISSQYVFRNVSRSQVTVAAEQGIATMLENRYHDPFTLLLSPSGASGLSQELAGKRQGSVGMALSLACGKGQPCPVSGSADGLVIEDVLFAQPAYQAGIRNGDLLLAVNGEPVSRFGTTWPARLGSTAGHVDGPAGTTVRIEVRAGGSGGQIQDFTVTRRNLVIPSVYSKLFGRVLYMQVTGFDLNTAAEARAQLKSGIAAGATSYILDLRNNPGGYVLAAQALVSDFVPEYTHGKRNVVVVQRERMLAGQGQSTALSTVTTNVLPGAIATQGKVVVLVNGGTASAAEITTLALRDERGADVVGSRTYGKGSVQVSFSLPDGNVFHMTVARWFGPRGEGINFSGIQPGYPVKLPSPSDEFGLATQGAPAAADTQLQEALKLAVQGGSAG